MFWIAVKGFDNGTAISLGTVEQYEAELYGMHGYPTQALAQAHPNTVNAVNRVQVEAWFANAEGVGLGGAIGAGAGKAAKAAASAVPHAFSLAFGNTGGLLGRIVKVTLGAVLLISGILRLTGADKAALGVAGKAAVLA